MDDYINVTRQDAIAVAGRVEGDFFDRKAAKIDGRGIQKIAVAFANADGGEIVIGIADDKDEPDVTKRWQGLPNPEDFNSHIQALVNLNPAIDFRHEFLKAESYPNVVLRVFVAKSVNVSTTADGKVYQRRGAQSLPVTDPAKVTALAFAKGAASYEDTVLPNLTAEDIVDSKVLAEFCAEITPPQEPLAFCVNEGLIDRKSYVPNSAGVLLFNENPQAVFPRRCGIKIVFYDTRQIVPEREHLKKNITISGPLYNLIHRAVAEIQSIMSNISIQTKDGYKKVDYPPEAIWEILVNAVIHRDYSIADDIQVVIFQDRIEIRSPGRLPGFVTTENFLDVRYSRNSKIVRCLARYKTPPNKDLGEGLNTAFQKMKEWKLQSPKLQEENNYVVVTIPHTPLASPEELIIEYLANNEEIRNKLARDLTGIRSENQMKEVFYRLRDRGLIERVPGKKGNAAAWRKPVPAEVQD
ncbi:ATP-binding protein [Ancylobacter sp. FA202]|uniref:ATP-binding protein n=1 Tax=Ancylobacter sp. FA202 TaxID=1111106 RepID=UPI00036B729B|nr:ATP-binding protein [Ancylobacter sp. FA202]